MRWLWLRGEKSVFVPEENRERNVRLVDFDDLTENLYHVTDEWTQRNPRCANRADVVFLVNGIPVAVCETKNAGKPDGIAIGIDPDPPLPPRDAGDAPRAQVFEVTELLDFYYAATWSTSRKNLFNWKEERPFDFAAAQLRVTARRGATKRPSSPSSTAGGSSRCCTTTSSS